MSLCEVCGVTAASHLARRLEDGRPVADAAIFFTVTITEAQPRGPGRVSNVVLCLRCYRRSVYSERISDAPQPAAAESAATPETSGGGAAASRRRGV